MFPCRLLAINKAEAVRQWGESTLAWWTDRRGAYSAGLSSHAWPHASPVIPKRCTPQQVEKDSNKSTRLPSFSSYPHWTSKKRSESVRLGTEERTIFLSFSLFYSSSFHFYFYFILKKNSRNKSTCVRWATMLLMLPALGRGVDFLETLVCCLLSVLCDSLPHVELWLSKTHFRDAI